MRFFRLVISSLLVAVISACNLPSTAKITPTEDSVAAAVRETLTALPTKTAVSTQIILLPTETQTSTPTPETTPTNAASPSPTPSGDPKSWLGVPTRIDTLDSAQGFGLAGGYEDSAARLVVSDGAMIMTSFSAVGWRTWRVRPPELSNAYLEGTFRTTNCSGSDQYGLVLRAPNYDTGFGYYFGITCDGKFSFSRWDATGNASLVTPTTDSSILQGSGQINRLGVMAAGNKFTLYINGIKIKDFEDNALAAGFFGAFLGGFSGNFTVQLEEIAYWVQP